MFPKVDDAKIKAWIPELNAVLHQYSITNLMRVWMFMAQTGHETDRYKTFVEYTNKDGTNAWCHKYDGGCKYRGRGAIQLTHKYNYNNAGRDLGVNFVDNPDVCILNHIFIFSYLSKLIFFISWLQQMNMLLKLLDSIGNGET